MTLDNCYFIARKLKSDHDHLAIDISGLIILTILFCDHYCLLMCCLISLGDFILVYLYEMNIQK